MGNSPPQKHPICWGVLKRNSEPLNTVQSRCGLGDEEGCVPIREKTDRSAAREGDFSPGVVGAVHGCSRRSDGPS